MKRYSLASASGLLILAVSAGFLYPLTQEPKTYLAEAKDYYDSYHWDGILYQKKQMYSASPKETYDADATYTLETWTYGNNQLVLTEKITGELWEVMSNDQMDLTDEWGNHSMYGNPKEYSLRKEPAAEEPYCIQSLSSETADSTTYSSHAFEVSPHALDLFNTLYLPQNLFYPFTESGELSKHIFTDGSSYTVYKNEEQPSAEEDSQERDLYYAMASADSSPEQAKLLFDLLTQGQAYTEESKVDENGKKLEVFRLPPVAYNEALSEAESIEEFVFNDQYQLLEVNSYKDEQLMDQVKYLETSVLPLTEKDSIFDPEAYGMKLVSFDHPLDFDLESLKKKALVSDLSCYSFQNEILSKEETQDLAETYAPMIQNLKDKWKPWEPSAF